MDNWRKVLNLIAFLSLRENFFMETVVWSFSRRIVNPSASTLWLSSCFAPCTFLFSRITKGQLVTINRYRKENYLSQVGPGGAKVHSLFCHLILWAVCLVFLCHSEWCAGLPGACNWKRPNSVLKKPKFWILLNELLEKKGQALNKCRLKKEANYLNSQKFRGQTFKKGKFGLEKANLATLMVGCQVGACSIWKMPNCFEKGKLLDFTI